MLAQSRALSTLSNKKLSRPVERLSDSQDVCAARCLFAQLQFVQVKHEGLQNGGRNSGLPWQGKFAYHEGSCSCFCQLMCLANLICLHFSAIVARRRCWNTKQPDNGGPNVSIPPVSSRSRQDLKVTLVCYQLLRCYRTRFEKCFNDCTCIHLLTLFIYNQSVDS